ncbi:hypothetical protein NMG60_11000022, partial [Bertholletia excelsa]
QPSVAPPVPLLPEKHILELVLDILQRRDTYEIFAEPVDPNEVEDYYKIIEEPMDFGTMRAKLHEGMYRSFDEFEHDVFLIPRNAMHFNSTSTIYFRQARAIYELAKKVFHVLKTDPENFELEFSCTRRRSARRLQREVKGLNFNSYPRFTVNCRFSRTTTEASLRSTKSSLTGPSNLRSSRDGRSSNFLEVDRRATYRPWASYHDQNNAIRKSKTKLLINQRDINYKESLMLFARGLGSTAQVIAKRKMQGWWIDGPNIQTPSSASNCWRPAMACQIPNAFASAEKNPGILDPAVTNKQPWSCLDPLPKSSVIKTTTDMVDLSDADCHADDGEKAACTCLRMGKANHSFNDLGGGSVTATYRNEGLTGIQEYYDGVKMLSVFDSEKMLEKQVHKTVNPGGWYSSSISKAENLNSRVVTSRKPEAVARTEGAVESGEMENQLVQQSVLIPEEHFQSRKTTTCSPWLPWQAHFTSTFPCTGFSDASSSMNRRMVTAEESENRSAALALRGTKYGIGSSSSQDLNQPPSFAFDLPFLKSQLFHMTSHLEHQKNDLLHIASSFTQTK